MQFAKNLQKFRLVTFDITDTLLKFKDDPAKVYAQAAHKHFKNIDEMQLRNCFRQQFKIMAKKYPNFGRKTQDMTWTAWWLMLVKNTFTCVDPNMDKKTLQQLSMYLFKIFRTKECWSTVNCAENLIRKVRENVECVGVISNFDPSLWDVLQNMNFLHNFDFVITSYEAAVQKPDKKIFDLALVACTCAEAHEALHIGNSFELDFLGAKNAGWSSLLVSSQKSAELSHAKNDFIYENICDMLKALEEKSIVW